jgi:hypothetical protein
MRNSTLHILAAAIVMAAGTSCARGHQQPQQDGTAETGAMGRGPQQVSLRGCVQAAPGFNHYVLHRVTFASEQPGDPKVAAEKAIIPPGSWVRLQPNKNDLKSYLGKQVSVNGEIVDTGANTIGSSTPPSLPTDRAQPPSSVPPRAADANGEPPLVSIAQISTIASTCKEK